MTGDGRKAAKVDNGGGATPGRKLLVTGAAGFIGSHLCERLLADGHSVWGLDNFDPFYAARIKRTNLETALEEPAMRLVEGDIRDGVLLSGLFSDIAFDGVIHLAARPGVRPSIEDPSACFDVNVSGTLGLLEAMRRADVKVLLFGSSSSVYGEREDTPFREDSDADHPISPYAASKRTGETLCHTYHHLYGMSVHCLRFFTVFGPRQRPDLAIHKFARLMADGEPIPVYGDGSSLRDYTYVDDVVEGVVLSLEHLLARGADEPAYELINLGRRDPVRLDELVGAISDAMGIRPEIDRLPDQPGDVPVTCASTERARSLLGYEPRVELAEGLSRFADWFRATDERNRTAPSAEAGAPAS